MSGRSRGSIQPNNDDFRPDPWSFDRRRFLQLTGLATVGLGSGAWASDEPGPIAPTEGGGVLQTEGVSQFAPLACGNSPIGGPFYHGMPAITKENDVGLSDKVLYDLDRAWPIGQTIIVKFLNGQNDPWVRQVQQKVREIAPTWCDYANVSMQFIDSGPCHMTVNFLPFVDQFGRHDQLFNCFLGTDCFRYKNQVQSMNLIFSPIMQQWPTETRESEFRRLILHEFGHALAMIHEHQRPDRPIVWMRSLFAHAQNTWGWNEQTVMQQIVNFENLQNLAGTVFDVNSIMMYEYPPGLAYYQKENAPPNTPDLTRPFGTQNNTRLSALDKVAAAVTYPKPGVAQIGEETLREGAAPRAGKIIEIGQVAPFRIRPQEAGDYTILVEGAMPALVGLMRNRNERGSRGKLANVFAAAEPEAGRTGTALVAKGLMANTDYFVEVRHQTPMKGTGEFTIALRRDS